MFPSDTTTGTRQRATTLHPNLARLAASYNHILAGHQRGEFDNREAQRRIGELVARDDNGLRWTINPRDGGWLYQGRSGAWCSGQPPVSGLATATPHTIGDRVGDVPHGYNPDWDLRLEPVTTSRTHDIRPRSRLRPVVVAAVAVLSVVAVGAFNMFTGGDTSPPCD